MSAPEPGGTRPGRAVGLLLIGLAVIAAVIGVITLIDDGNDGTQEPLPPPFPPSTSAPATSGPNPNPPPSNGTSPPPPTGAPTTGAPPTSEQPQPPPPQPPPQPQPPPNPRDVPVRVYNNGTISGLAAQAAGDFRGDGWNVTEVGNYSQGLIPTSTVYYRPGTEEEAAARELALRFNMRAEPRFDGIANSPPGLIVILTNDYGGK
jgi:hypothetical protein